MLAAPGETNLLEPDLVIPSHYYNEGVLFLRTLQRQRVTPKAIYSVLGGASSQYRFLDEFPDAERITVRTNPVVVRGAIALGLMWVVTGWD